MSRSCFECGRPVLDGAWSSRRPAADRWRRVAARIVHPDGTVTFTFDDGGRGDRVSRLLSAPGICSGCRFDAEIGGAL